MPSRADSLTAARAGARYASIADARAHFASIRDVRFPTARAQRADIGAGDFWQLVLPQELYDLLTLGALVGCDTDDWGLFRDLLHTHNQLRVAWERSWRHDDAAAFHFCAWGCAAGAEWALLDACLDAAPSRHRKAVAGIGVNLLAGVEGAADDAARWSSRRRPAVEAALVSGLLAVGAGDAPAVGAAAAAVVKGWRRARVWHGLFNPVAA